MDCRKSKRNHLLIFMFWRTSVGLLQVCIRRAYADILMGKFFFSLLIRIYQILYFYHVYGYTRFLFYFMLKNYFSHVYGYTLIFIFSRVKGIFYFFSCIWVHINFFSCKRDFLFFYTHGYTRLFFLM